MKTYTVAVVGATGLVGGTMLSVLESRRFPIGRLLPLASACSAGKEVVFGGQKHTVQALSEQTLSGAEVVFFAAGGTVSKQWAPIAADWARWWWTTTACSAWRRISRWWYRGHPGDLKRTGIANPNCSTIQSVVALNPFKRWESSGWCTAVIRRYRARASGG